MNKKIILQFVLFIILFLVIDSIWLIGGKKLHQKTVQDVQKSELKIDKLAGLLFYVLAAIIFILIVKRYSNKDPIKALQLGALLGLAMYGTFDITNKAIFKDYTWSYALMDMTWGSFVFGLTSYCITKYT